MLQFLHASYNVGGIIGALGAGLTSLAGVDFRARLSVTAVVLAIVAIYAALSPPLRAQPGPSATETKISLSIFLRSRALIVPAVVVLSAFFVEGSMDIWSVIYLRRTLEASAFAGGIAFAVFSLAMAFGRITAGRVLFGLGYRATLSLGGGIARGRTHGGDHAEHGRRGRRVPVPGILHRVGRTGSVRHDRRDRRGPCAGGRSDDDRRVFGFVVGPPLMGLLAETAGLRATMVVLVAMSLGVVAGGVFGHPKQVPKQVKEPDLPPRLDPRGRGKD